MTLSYWHRFVIQVLSARVAMTETKKRLVERLFAEHGGSLQAFLYRRVRRHPVAAELAQEAYVRMLRIPDMGAIRNPEAYLYTVASNLAKEHARHEPKGGSVLDVDDPLVQDQLAELPALGGQLDTEQRVKMLREVLHQLPPKCHAAVVLQYWQGLSYEEIGQRLGVSTHMVKKYLSQALVHCRRRMARLG
jgi:RNA polymerase sigma factor (sigma-70 family)